MVEQVGSRLATQLGGPINEVGQILQPHNGLLHATPRELGFIALFPGWIRLPRSPDGPFITLQWSDRNGQSLLWGTLPSCTSSSARAETKPLEKRAFPSE